MAMIIIWISINLIRENLFITFKLLIMKRIALTFFILTFLSSSVLCQKGITGKWNSDKRNSEGMGTVLLFGPRDNAKMITAVIVDFDYKVKGDSLIFILNPNEFNTKEVINTAEFKFKNDTLYLFPNEPTRTQKLVRIEKVAKPKDLFSGIWKFKHEKGYDATWQFTKKGIAQLTINLQTTEAKYTLKKDEVIIKFKDKPTENPDIKINGNHMVLTSKIKKTSEKFSRLEP